MPTRPNGVPSGRLGDSLPSLAERRDPLRLGDAVDALIGDERAGPLLVVSRVVLDQQQLGGLVDRLAPLEEVETGIDRRNVHGVTAVDRAGRPDGQKMVIRRGGRMRYLANARSISVSRNGEVGRPFIGPGEGGQGLDAARTEREPARPRLAVFETPAAQRRITRIGQVARSKRRTAVRHRAPAV